MTSANGHVISRCARDPTFHALIKQADAIDADGMSVVFASQWLTDSPLSGRVATTDYFHDAAAAAAKYGISFFLLGATPEENERAVSKIRDLYPRLRIAGYHHGFFGINDEKRLVIEITQSRTDILWVGLGVPREHEFITRNRRRLRGVTWAKSCGGLFNFLSETNRRAPEWMQVAGLEWLHRVMLEPKRLFWRYFSTNVHAIYTMLRQSSSLAPLEGRGGGIVGLDQGSGSSRRDSTTARAGGSTYSPTMSQTLVAKLRSAESLKLRT
jgi:exopolysaccharide biosynthesis WecB/TagA/CpsF family protein